MTLKAGQPVTNEQALDIWTELHRLISVGAYEERGQLHYETDTWPEDGVEESIHNLEAWAERQGREFVFNHDGKDRAAGYWTLESIAARGE